MGESQTSVWVATSNCSRVDIRGGLVVKYGGYGVKVLMFLALLLPVRQHNSFTGKGES